MRISFLILGFLAVAWALPEDYAQRAPAKPCDNQQCKLPNCRCSTTDTPGGLNVSVIPQFVMLTFNGAVQTTNVDYFRAALYNRTNPSGCPVSATFFVPHEYNDYTLVHELHANGHEIALNSITYNSNVTYWSQANETRLAREFSDQRLMFEHFSKVPRDQVRGIRMPLLQMAGDAHIRMLANNNFTYDFSRGTMKFMSPGLWPYTYDYESAQDCLVGPCAEESVPGVWQMPMIHWNNDDNDHTCAIIDACVNSLNRTDNEFEWMKTEFLKQYRGNRAPFSVSMRGGWFQGFPDRLEQYVRFLDYLQSLPDVYIASANQVLEWMKSPMNLTQYTNVTCQNSYEPNCVAKSCTFNEELQHFMTICDRECPDVYPWYGNPLGNITSEIL